MLSAHAVFPIDGRAARMMSSPRWKPLVMSSSCRNPVGRPVSARPAARSIASSVCWSNSCSETASRVSRRCAIEKIRASAAWSTSSAPRSPRCDASSVSTAAAINSRTMALSRTIRACSTACAAVGALSASSRRKSSPPTWSSVPAARRRSASWTMSIVAVRS